MRKQKTQITKQKHTYKMVLNYRKLSKVIKLFIKHTIYLF